MYRCLVFFSQTVDHRHSPKPDLPLPKAGLSVEPRPLKLTSSSGGGTKIQLFLHDKKTPEVVYLQIFLSTVPIDMSVVTCNREPPVTPGKGRGAGGILVESEPIIPSCDRITVPIIVKQSNA